ncbi:uncharacterized protein LOC141587960 [Silene latifolia]|uniref:uncharacterized protein LOC141587960 n=1 Tax=Silene latifolia TaxID=37657 RepID=UPI003D76E8E2
MTANRCIQSESWNVNGFPLVLRPGHQLFQELDLCVHFVLSVWVLFPNLDPCFWSQAALSKVASFVGRPICADEPTTNKSKIAFARILVEVDLSKELPKGMTLQTPYRGTVLQKIVYEWLPYYCHTCHKIGHTMDRCNKNKVRQVYQPKRPHHHDAKSDSDCVGLCTTSDALLRAWTRMDFLVTNSKKRSMVLEVDNDTVHVELDCGSVVDLEPGGIPPPLSPQ